MIAPCPYRCQLEPLLLEQLSAAEEAVLNQHLEGCEGCRRRLDEITTCLEFEQLAGKHAGAELAAAPRSPAPPPEPGVHAERSRTTGPAVSPPRRGDAFETTDGADELPAIPGFQVVATLGRGASSIVYQARQEGLDRYVALKVLHATSGLPLRQRQRFLREAQAVARLQHPQIVQIFGAGEFGGLLYLVLQFIDGESLVQRLQSGLPQPREAAQLVEKLARAVHYAHEQGIIHRDLKPANVLLSRFDGSPWITDFGIAKQLQTGDSPTTTSEILGTPQYMAPEQVRPLSSGRGGALSLGPAADVYALGVILYECLGGRPPFAAPTPIDTLLQVLHDEPLRLGRLQPQVPRDLETIVHRCLEKDPRRRYHSAAELADDLQRFLAGRPIRARRVTVWEQGVKWARRQPLTAGLMITVMVAVWAGVAGVTWQWRNAVRSRNAAVASARAESRARFDAQAARDNEARAHRSTQLRLAELNVAAGLRRLDEGDPATALLRFLEAMRLDLQADGRLPAPGTASAVLPAGRTDCSFDDRERRHRLRLASVLQATPQLRQMWFHDAGVTRVAASPDGAWLASVGADGATHLYSLARDMSVASPPHQPTRLECVTFTPDSRRLITCTAAGELCVWDTAAGSLLARTDRVAFVATNVRDSVPLNGRFAARLADGKTVQPWPLADPDAAPPLLSDLVLDEYRQPVFSPAGEWLVALHKNAISRWDTTDWKVVHNPAGADRWLQVMAFQRDGARFVVISHRDWTAQLWETDTLQPVGPALPHETMSGAIRTAAFSPDGRLLATGGAGRTVYVWDTTSPVPRYTPLFHADRIDYVRFTPDGWLVTVCRDRTVHIWNVATSRLAVPVLPHGSHIRTLDIHPEGRLLITGCDDGSVRVWDLSIMEPEEYAGSGLPPGSSGPESQESLPTADVAPSRPPEPPAFAVHRPSTAAPGPVASNFASAGFSADGRRLLTVDEGGNVRLFDRSTRSLLGPPLPSDHPVQRAEFSADGRWIVTVDQSLAARIWDAATGQPATPPLGRQLGNGMGVSRARLSPDGTLLLLVYGERFNVYAWMEKQDLLSNQKAVTSALIEDVLFLGDGRRIATTGTPSPRIWQLPAGFTENAPAAMLECQGEAVYRLLHARADGQRLAGAADGQVTIWDTASGEPVASVPLDGLATGLCFSPDGRCLAVSHSRTVTLWEPETGKAIGEPMRHAAAVRSVAISPDQRYVVTAGVNGIVYLWDAETGERLSPAWSHEAPAVQAEFSRDGRWIATATARGAACVWPVPDPVLEPLDQLVTRAQLLSSQKLGESGSVRTLSAAELRAAWQRQSKAGACPKGKSSAR